MSSSEDEFDSELSVSNVFKKMKDLWIIEKNSPEILKYDSCTVDHMKAQIENMERNLSRLTSPDDFRSIPCQMEVNRIRYIVAGYFRCRLEKIEAFAEQLLERDTELELEDCFLSPAETVFAQQYVKFTKEHFDTEVMKYLPQGAINTQQLPPIKLNTRRAVFVDIVKPSQSILLHDRSDDIELPVGSRHLLPYEDVVSLIKNRSAVLL